MNMLRKLGWAAVLVTSGMPHSTVVPADSGAPASGASSTPAGGAEPRPAAHEPQAQPKGWPWPFASGDEDLGDDDFEGEGWTFWGL